MGFFIDITPVYETGKALIIVSSIVILILISVEDIRTMTISDRYSIALFALAVADAAIGILALNSRAGVVCDGVSEHVMTASGAGACLRAASWQAVVLDRAAGALIVSGMMSLLNLIRQAAGKSTVFGGGDVLLCFSAGALLGAVKMIEAAAVSMIAAGLYAAAGLLLGKFRKDSAFPFGPFLAFGIAYSLLF